MPTRKFGREEQKAIFARLKDKKSVRVGIMKPLNNKERRASEFVVIPIGSANPEHENFGLPTFTIPRAEALKIRKENRFDAESSRFGGTTHVGNFPIEDLKRLSVKDPDAFIVGKVKQTTEERKQETAKAKGKFAFKKDIKDVDELGTGDPHQIPQTILDQLGASKVNGFPFFKLTGIKGFVLEGNDTLQLREIPKNPKDVSIVRIRYDEGQDLYNINFQTGQFPRNQPFKDVGGVFFDQMAEIIAREMGVLNGT
jgi:hypothetical protein